MYIRHSDKEVGDSTAKVVNSEQITIVKYIIFSRAELVILPQR